MCATDEESVRVEVIQLSYEPNYKLIQAIGLQGSFSQNQYGFPLTLKHV